MTQLEKSQAKMAIREATRMWQRNEDPYYIAKTLLKQSYRLRQLEALLKKAEELLQANSSSQAGQELRKAIDELNQLTQNTDTEQSYLM